MDVVFPVVLFVFSGILSAVATAALVPWLLRQKILDIPIERSNHSIPVPRGGGISVIGAIVSMWIVSTIEPFRISDDQSPDFDLALIIAVLILAAVSWYDDIKSATPLFRLLVQIVVVGAIVFLMPFNGTVFQGLLPHWVDQMVTVVLWIWFINLFNFMDGIDGISCVETAAIGLGVAAIGLVAGLGLENRILGLIVAGSAFGFLRWNWQPAKVFLGDVGSIPLGFILGWLLLDLAADGYWVPALILPLYYLTDATLTLIRRALAGKRIWEAHREHYYQQAVAKGHSHAKVSLLLAATNILLVGFAVTAIFAPSGGIVAAASVVFILLLYFKVPGENVENAE